MKVMRVREGAATLHDRILRFLARERQPELCGIRVVRGPADRDPMMPPFVGALLNHMWVGQG